MAYEAKTEAGKLAISEGADPDVVEAQEKEGTLTDAPGDGKEKEKKGAEHVETPATPPAKTPAADKEQGDDKGGEGGDGKGKEGKGEGVGGDEPPDRIPQSMPVWKHKEELKKLRDELEAGNASAIEQAVAAAVAKQGGATSEDVTKLAEEFNLTPDVATAMIDRITSAIEKKLGLSDIRKSVEEGAETRKRQQEEEGFMNEWGSKATQDALKSLAGDKPITDEIRAKVKELAYRTDYARYRLPHIIQLEAANIFSAPAAK